jgi:hypothetical protein
MGLTAISIAHLVLTTVFFPINIYIGMRVLTIPYKKLLNSLWISATGAIGIFFISIFLQKVVLNLVPLSPAAILTLTVAVGSLAYISHIFFISNDTFWEMRDLIKSAIAK